MGARNAILRRWNRRDVFAVLVIGVTVAFLTGTTLVVVAAATGTTEVARGRWGDRVRHRNCALVSTHSGLAVAG